MRIPDLAGLAKKAINITEPSGTPLLSPVDVNQVTRKSRSHARALSVPKNLGGEVASEAHGLNERQDCAVGTTYYSCANGFSGCCASNPCDATAGGCPAATTKKATAVAKTTQKAASTKKAATTKAATGVATVKTVGQTTAKPATKTGTQTAKKTGTASGTKAASATKLTTTIPASGSAAGIISTVTITPTPTASATPASSSSGGTNVGAIVGGVVGGVAGLLLICGLIIFFTRRQRRKVDERKLKEKMEAHISPPVMPASQETYDTYAYGHQRSGSTSHDVFLPPGGFIRDPDAKTESDRFSELEGHTSTPPGRRAEHGNIPASVFKTPQMLDSTPIGTPMQRNSAASKSRSSLFKEHISEMPDNSSLPPHLDPGSPYSKNGESPILGRQPPSSSPSLAEQTRRKQHLMSWNNYEPNQAQSKDSDTMSGSLTQRTPANTQAH